MYLYGASIQGIQSFIFETNKLKEIVGASDLIEWFCSNEFIEKFASEYKIKIDKENIVRNAGGNIRIIFNTKEVEKFVKFFPKYVMQKAYGITISQAVVEFNKGEYLNQKDDLEFKLIKARNRNSNPLDARFNFMKHTPRSAKPAIIYENEEYFDRSSYQKHTQNKDAWKNIILKKLKLDSVDKFPIKIDEIANENNKVAVIHADGNEMGIMLQKMNDYLKNKSDEEIQKVFKIFSQQIKKSTNSAVKSAFEKTFEDAEIIPFRPVVIGGDDVSVICDANKALEFTKNYLEEFEKETAKNFKENNLDKYATKLTACAGIAFCNKKFPFHYAIELAENLCSFAKEESNRKNSCLAFHNIQSSFVENYKTFMDEELTANDIKLLFAPYYIDKTPKIDTLLNLYEKFSNKDIPLGKYRKWISELFKNKEYAKLLLERIDSILKTKIDTKTYDELNDELQKLHKDLKLDNLIVENKTPMQDILQLKSVKGR